MELGNDYSIEVKGLEIYLLRGNLSLVQLGSYNNENELNLGLDFCKKHMKRVMFLYESYLESEYIDEQRFFREFIVDTCSVFQGRVADYLIDEFA